MALINKADLARLRRSIPYGGYLKILEKVNSRLPESDRIVYSYVSGTLNGHMYRQDIIDAATEYVAELKEQQSKQRASNKEKIKKSTAA